MAFKIIFFEVIINIWTRKLYVKKPNGLPSKSNSFPLTFKIRIGILYVPYLYRICMYAMYRILFLRRYNVTFNFRTFTL